MPKSQCFTFSDQVLNYKRLLIMISSDIRLKKVTIVSNTKGILRSSISQSACKRLYLLLLDVSSYNKKVTRRFRTTLITCTKYRFLWCTHLCLSQSSPFPEGCICTQHQREREWGGKQICETCIFARCRLPSEF